MAESKRLKLAKFRMKAIKLKKERKSKLAKFKSKALKLKRKK